MAISRVFHVTFALVLTIAFVVIANPVPQTWILRDSQLYVLRANWYVNVVHEKNRAD